MRRLGVPGPVDVDLDVPRADDLEHQQHDVDEQQHVVPVHLQEALALCVADDLGLLGRDREDHDLLLLVVVVAVLADRVFGPGDSQTPYTMLSTTLSSATTSAIAPAADRRAVGSALVTILATEGSAPRGPGARPRRGGAAR